MCVCVCGGGGGQSKLFKENTYNDKSNLVMFGYD